jgi:hypothetical protein
VGRELRAIPCWWTGTALFFAAAGVLFLATGHWWWGGFALLFFLFALAGIVAAVRYGKATPRNIERLFLSARLWRSDR